MAVRRRQPLCRAQFYLCGVVLGGGSYARVSHVDSTNRKILQNHVSVSIRESYPGVKYKMADSEVEALINAVGEIPSMWLVNSKSYKDQRARENAWKMVLSASGFPVETPTKKWKNLRDKFVKELRQVKVLHSGDEGPPATFSWKFFNIMYFLKDAQ